MSIKEIKVRIPDLEPGMYVSQLDRPWVETPYHLQGFLIETRDDIDELFKHCKYVFVDVELSTSSGSQKLSPRTSELSNNEKKESLTNIKPAEYENETELDDELTSARENHSILSNVAENIMLDISNNKKLNLPSLKKAINPMVNSIIRNPDAFSWLTRMKHKDN